eukprot:5924950-Amphidinium_carterae.2
MLAQHWAHRQHWAQRQGQPHLVQRQEQQSANPRHARAWRAVRHPQSLLFRAGVEYFLEPSTAWVRYNKATKVLGRVTVRSAPERLLNTHSNCNHNPVSATSTPAAEDFAAFNGQHLWISVLPGPQTLPSLTGPNITAPKEA